jgi:integrase
LPRDCQSILAESRSRDYSYRHGADDGHDGQGRRRRGKPQLRVDEARKLTDFLLRRCQPLVQPEAVAVLTVLLLATRASEVIERDVRDLDDAGTILWIPDSKTDRGRRVLEVPEILQPLLRDRDGARPTRHWTLYWCKQMCSLAGVPVITAQGFRGTHRSIAHRGGASGRIVQEQLGHASLAMAEGGAYVQREAVQAGDAHTVELRLLRGGRA